MVRARGTAVPCARLLLEETNLESFHTSIFKKDFAIRVDRRPEAGSHVLIACS
jgi:hypothetical protein